MNYKFDEYYKAWDKHGVKLTCRIDITKDLLDRVTGKPDICDIIWAVNAVNQSDKSCDSLSNTVMDNIQKLLPLLLDHKSFIEQSSDYVKKRAIRHYNSDPHFEKRQIKIRNILEGYINQSINERNNTRSVEDCLSYLPCKEDFRKAYRVIAVEYGKEVAMDVVLDQIKREVEKTGKKMKPNWRMITETNIAIWQHEKDEQK